MSRRTNIKDKVVESRDYGRRPFLGKGRFGNMMRTLTDRAVINVKKFSQSEFKKPYRNDEFNYMENVYNPRGGFSYMTPEIPIPDIPSIIDPSDVGNISIWPPDDLNCSCTGGGCCDPVTGIAEFTWTCTKGKNTWYRDYSFGDRCAKADYPGGDPVKVNLCAGECCSDYDLYKCNYYGDDPTPCDSPNYVPMECHSDNVEELTPPGSVTLTVTGGFKNYTVCGGGDNGWAFEGASEGKCFEHWATTSPHGKLTAAANACGSGWIQVTDKCGNSVRCTVRSTVGVWNDDSDCEVCGDRNDGVYHVSGECRTSQGYSDPCTGVGTRGDCPGCFAAYPCTATCGVCVPASKPSPAAAYLGSYPCWYLSTSSSGSCHQYCYCPICTGASGIVSQRWECA